MSGLRRTLLTVAALGAIAVPTALASPSSPSSSPSASSSSASSGTAPSGTKHIKVDKPFSIALDAHGHAEQNKLPTPSTLFTRAELAQVLPGLSNVSVNDDTQTLTINGDSNSTLQIVLKQFGKKDDVTKAWAKEKSAHEQRSGKNPGLYTFFGNRLGATDAFTDGTNTHVLVTSGAAAGEIWFSGCGFTNLASDYATSRTTYSTKVVPALVQLIADKAKQGAASQAGAPKS